MEPDATVRLALGSRERELLLEEVTVAGGLYHKIAVALAEDEHVVLELTLDEWDDLAAYIAIAADLCADPGRQRELAAFYDRVVALLDTLRPPPTPGADTPPDLSALDRGARTVSLTVYQMRRLMEEWDGDTPAVRLSPDLGLAELEGARILLNARIMLRALVETGGTKATAAGNLNRKFVSSMLDQFHTSPGFADSVRRICKAINESDFWPLHVLRVVLRLARLIIYRKGRFAITKRGRELLADDRAGELYALLFRTHFRKFNLAYGDPLPPAADDFQYTVGFCLFALDHFADEWRDVARISEALVLPMIKEQLAEYAFFREPAWLVRARLVSPLEEFGLLERRVIGKQGVRDIDEIRKTPLFDRFLSFDPGPSGLHDPVPPLPPGVH